MYERIGLRDCIATDRDDFVKRAVGIASDAGTRASIARRLRESSHALFSQPAAARELEAFFVQACRQGGRVAA
jgi:predicted O-linked N-acetylglucosamine transferase (SPINDLY family)